MIQTECAPLQAPAIASQDFLLIHLKVFLRSSYHPNGQRQGQLRFALGIVSEWKSAVQSIVRKTVRL